ncbi:ABC transporter substrate-binding protein [Haloarcula marina]|uniref:ABC transporter substrate-binding protein n=1 Tax=Haloarcula marina TaxID=2961574 RepID=UPI0020B6BED3|nr:ABC transporter substrate-binding protein [Halomicroarcula marina]
MNEYFYNLNQQTGELREGILTDVSQENNTLTLELSDQYTWHNGDDVTADDLYTQLNIAKFFGGIRRTASLPSAVQGIEKNGEYKVDLQLSEPINIELFLIQSFIPGGAGTAFMWMPDAVFGEFSDRIDEAGSDQEEAIKQDVLEFTWAPEDAYGCGPFELTDSGATRFSYELYEDYPGSANINWTGASVEKVSGSDIIPAVRSNNVDFANSTISRSDAESLPENWDYTQSSVYGGPALLVNHDHDLLSQIEVKHALAHVIDNESLARNAGDFGTNAPPSTYAGYVKENSQQILGPPIEGNLISYDSEEEATSLLQSVGFSKEDGEWYKPNGDRWSMSITTFNAPTWNSPTRGVASQFRQFGIDAEPNIVEGGQFFGEYPSGGYDVAVEFSGQSFNPNPFFAYPRNFTGFGGGSMNFPTTVEAPAFGERGGELQTYDIPKMINRGFAASNQDELVTQMRRLAWVHNYTLPTIPLTVMVRTNMYNTDDWEYPPEGEAFSWNGSHGIVAAMMRQGTLQAKTE